MIKKRIISVLTAALSAVMLFSATAFAASSPSTQTVSTQDSTQAGTSVWRPRDRQYLLSHVSELAGDGTVAYIGSMRVSADYTDATDSGLTLLMSSSYLGENSHLKNLLNDINTVLPEGYEVADEDVFDLTLRYSDGSIYEGMNGYAYDITFGVGNEYDGLTVTVYLYNGVTLTPYSGTVSKGKVTIENVKLSGLVCLYVAKPVGYI